ncbi:MAG: threonylcarbamoyl-AMP synthase [Lachnospiraceae bacterium]|nr:threonylcarbamoyl-AMP synthase [Lachnospiraceae bacterium]
METVIYRLDDYCLTDAVSEADREKLKKAASILAEGGLVAFPTETVYGLGGNALNPESSRHIYAAKGRPSDNPLIVHIADIKDLKSLVSDIPEAAQRLADRFWPGPMTMVFRKSGLVPKETTGGLDTIAVRFPVHPVAMELIRLSGVPIAAPSANLSGRPSTTTAEHCIEDLTGRIDAIVDGGSAEIGVESTIIDVSGPIPQLLRPGAVTKEMIEETLGITLPEDAAIRGPLAPGVRPKAPGMKYRHYAPKAPLQLIVGRDGYSGVAKAAAELLLNKAEAGIKPALLCTPECLEELKTLDSFSEKDIIIRLAGSRADRQQTAHDLFEMLRELDETEAEFIVAEGCPEDQLGQAIMNRLKKAAAWQIMYV